MDTLLVVLQIVALVCVSAVCIALIVVLLRVRDVVTRLERDFREMSTRALPVLENLEFITARVKGIAENVDDQLGAVKDSLESVRQVAQDVLALERRVQEGIEGPILEGVAFISALFKGVRVFVDRVRG